MLRIKRLLKKPNCIVLFQDEKNIPIKLHSGYEWRIKRRTIPLNQKVKEVLILFGIYSLHENFRYFKFYPSNNSYYFVKFIKKIEKKFKDKIYIILDNHGSHTSNYTKTKLKEIKKVKLVFLPYNSPKLNRIEDEFSLYKREVLNNRKFKSKKEIIVATRKWINYRNNMGIV